MATNELVLSEHRVHQSNGGLTVQVVAVVDKHTQYLDGIPLDGFTSALKFEYGLQGLQNTTTSVALADPADLYKLANALIGAGHKLEEAVKKAERGRDQ